VTQLEPPAAEPRDDGFLIVAVLWIVAMLATLVVMYSFFTRQATDEMLALGERAQALALAESGVELAVYQITANPQVRPAAGRFSFRQGRALVNVAFTSENSRINLNFASKQVLAGLFTALGAQQSEVLEFADRIVAWRSPLAADAPDNETPLYLAAGRKYGPRHGPFQHVDELGLVLDLPAWLIHRALPYLTVYSESSDINMVSAPPEVLAALPGVSPELVQLLLGQRGSIPNDVLMTQLGMAASYITMLPGLSNRIDVDVEFPTGRHVRAEAVVLVRPDDVEPYRVLAWREEELAKD
jgi:general secretion pathway protein K